MIAIIPRLCSGKIRAWLQLACGMRRRQEGFLQPTSVKEVKQWIALWIQDQSV